MSCINRTKELNTVYVPSEATVQLKRKGNVNYQSVSGPIHKSVRKRGY